MRYPCASFGDKLLGQTPLWTLLACGTVSKSLTLSEAQFSLWQDEATHRSQLRLQGLNEIKGVKHLESRLIHSRCRCRCWLLSFSVRVHVSDAGSSQLPGACSLPRSVFCYGGNVQGTDLCYQALVAWAGGSGNLASILMRKMLNIYS